MLTEKQYNLLMFINKINKETGQCPSFDEMKDAIGLKSKSGIHALINSLEERNFIKKLPHKARALEVIRLPRFKPTAILEEEKKRSIMKSLDKITNSYGRGALTLAKGFVATNWEMKREFLSPCWTTRYKDFPKIH